MSQIEVACLSRAQTMVLLLDLHFQGLFKVNFVISNRRSNFWLQIRKEREFIRSGHVLHVELSSLPITYSIVNIKLYIFSHPCNIARVREHGWFADFASSFIDIC